MFISGPVLTTTIPDKQHTLWLHGNPMIVKATHTLAPSQATQQHTSEYAEVSNQSGLPTVKLNPTTAPPEPYATVTLKRNGQQIQQIEETCNKCTGSPSSSEYNAPAREPLNLCDILPPPPDHPYGAYKPPNNMTIRTNPAAMSPQVLRRIPPTPPRWGTLPPPIPNFPQNWMTNQRGRHQNNLDNGHHDMYSENDYESGSVLYEQCCRPHENNFFSQGGEPTEEYYRNVNMEFYDDQNYEPSTPPPPCPDISYNNKLNTNLRLLVNNQMNQQQDSPMNTKRINRNQQNLTNGYNIAQMQTPSPLCNGIIMNGSNCNNMNGMNNLMNGLGNNGCNGMMNGGTCGGRGVGGGGGNSGGGSSDDRNGSGSTPSANSSDESESDNNRWAPRSRRSRSRSKSSDRKYRNNIVGNNGQIR